MLWIKKNKDKLCFLTQWIGLWWDRVSYENISESDEANGFVIFQETEAIEKELREYEEDLKGLKKKLRIMRIN